MSEYSLVIYDTSDFEGFPLGGQLTSVRNFLRYLGEFHRDAVAGVLLVGVTTEENREGRPGRVEVAGASFDFFPVLCRSADLSGVKSSLRAAYLRGLCRYRRQLPAGANVVHYLHTPEAFLYLQLFHPFCRTAVFSHGSFFNMGAGIRFCRNSGTVKLLLNLYLRFLLRRADLVFALDRASEEQYRRCHARVVPAENSVVLPEAVPKQPHEPLRLLYAGRLSAVKRVDGILRALAETDRVELTVAGDGEEREALLALAGELNLGDRVRFLGAVSQAQVGALMDSSDILVLNSSLEGKPMTVIEALAHGLPAAVTPVGGLPELVIPGENGVFLGEEGMTLAAAAAEIVSHYGDYTRNARQSARRYDYRTVNEAIFVRLTDLGNRGRRPDRRDGRDRK